MTSEDYDAAREIGEAAPPLSDSQVRMVRAVLSSERER
jgi:hypothetical protein